MPIVKFQNLKEHIHPDKKIRSTVWLIHGEEFLCGQALEVILSSFLPTSADRMNYEPLGGSDDQVPLALEKVNTYTFLPGYKIVSLLGSRIFDSKKNTPDLLDKARSAHAEDNLKGAGRFFMRLLGVIDLSLDEIAEKDRRRLLKIGAGEDDQWLDPVINYCRDKGLKVPNSTDKSQLLENAVTRGLPENHHLIITTDITDRRRRLYKVIAENGMVIDCSVATGSRQAEKKAQEAVLKERMAAILKKFDKKMDTAAFRTLVEKTGFNLRTFCTSLEKLVNYVGDRHRIQVADVEKTLNRTRQDPVFELTSAVAERNTEAGLFFLKSMIIGELHPLQIIAAIANQIRKLIVAREFIESAHGRQWRPRIPYDQFRRSVMPAVVAYDDELRGVLTKWESSLIPNDQTIKNEGARPKKKKRKKKKPPSNQLVLAPNPNSPYPVFKTLENANRFTTAELIRALENLYATDLRLKTGERNPELVLGNLIIRICHHEKVEKK